MIKMQSGVDLETIISLEASAIKFGEGATAELGYEVKRRGCRNVVLITDKRIAKLLPVEQSIESLTRESIKVTLYNNAEVEPTDKSFMAAAEFARSGSFDGFVAVGGGSVIDTAKAANLYSTYPAEFLTYVNRPVGKGAPVPGMCKPLFAIPTTAGTGSETTGVAIFDFLEMSTKTGISSRELRPVLGIVDPNHTKTLPPMVAAASGFDVLSHALESYTALPFDKRVSPSSPVERPSYQGSNPVSDVWALKAIEMVAKKLKILHVTNFNERHNGRLFFNTGRRINNGFIRLGNSVLEFSDRDIQKYYNKYFSTKNLPSSALYWYILLLHIYRYCFIIVIYSIILVFIEKIMLIYC